MSSEIDSVSLVQRLVADPEDQAALAQAAAVGQTDPAQYAELLEAVGEGTESASIAGQWFSEAGNVWLESASDVHRSASAFMRAVDLDGKNPAPAERLADLYRGEGDSKALAALLERRVRVLTPEVGVDPAVSATLVALHEELGRLWAAEPLSSVDKALVHFRQALGLRPEGLYSIYAIRELLKFEERFSEALPYFRMERELTEDPVRELALSLDEAAVALAAGSPGPAAAALRNALLIGPTSAAERQQFATLVLELLRTGARVEPDLLVDAAQTLVGLSEQFPQHGLAHALCALELVPDHDRAMQLGLHYAEAVGEFESVAVFAAEYASRNPTGEVAEQAREAAERCGVAVAEPPAEATGEEPAVGAEDPLEFGLQSSPTRQANSDEASARLVQAAAALHQQNRRGEAASKYAEVLALSPAQPAAVEYLQGFLRRARRFAELRDMLSGAAEVEGTSYQQRAGWLREVASLSENQLDDVDGALTAWRRLSELGSGDGSPGQFRRLLERAGRWHEVAKLLRAQAAEEHDLEARIALEKDLSSLCQTRLKDPVAAAEALARIAALVPGDDLVVDAASKLFEQGGRLDLASEVIASNISAIDDPGPRTDLLARLAALRTESGDEAGAAKAFREAAELSGDAELWELAELRYLDVGDFEQAAQANAERVRLFDREPERQGELMGRAAGYLRSAGMPGPALQLLLEASEKAPSNEAFAAAVQAQMQEAGRGHELPQYWLARAAQLEDVSQRVDLRKRAARQLRSEMGDHEAAQRAFELVVQDTEDEEALSVLADEAEAASDWAGAVGYVRRLGQIASATEAVQLWAREAHLRADGLKDLDGAAAAYEAALEQDPGNVGAWAALASLEAERGNADRAAAALERQSELSDSADAKAAIGLRLADLYERELGDPEGALRALLLVREHDPSALDVVERIVDVAEQRSDWDLVASHLQTLVSSETELEALGRLSDRLATILHTRLDRSEEALKCLELVADRGHEGCRQHLVLLADEVGNPLLAAQKLMLWHAGAPREAEGWAQSMHGALARFVAAGADDEALSVARELGAGIDLSDGGLADSIEAVAVRAQDVDLLHTVFVAKAQALSGWARAEELVRQAQALAEAGVASSLAIQHGEQALAGVPSERSEPLLARLAALAETPGGQLDVYERHADRIKEPHERWLALSRSAQVGVRVGEMKRASGFLRRALLGPVPQGGLEVLEQAARDADAERGPEDTSLRSLLIRATAHAGQSVHASASVRSGLLCRAALLAYRELGDDDQAFAWLADALVTCVSPALLDSLSELSLAVGDHSREAAVLTAALEEVFDLPSVKLLLQRRAAVRSNHLHKAADAAADLSRLNELLPGDSEVLAELRSLYTELGDHQNLVNLYEDQIVRTRDSDEQRADLARLVAQLWSNELDNPREAAEAWRRVLRLCPDDTEAKAGFEKARERMSARRRTEVLGGSSGGSAPLGEPESAGLPLEDPEDEEVRDEELSLDDDMVFEDTAGAPRLHGGHAEG